ncbi:hypothetical protein LB503_003344 [Fusarium chuoi]|nr:hypothetical protein LB503_003344 [Fusarium chuoi]
MKYIVPRIISGAANTLSMSASCLCCTCIIYDMHTRNILLNQVSCRNTDRQYIRQGPGRHAINTTKGRSLTHAIADTYTYFAGNPLGHQLYHLIQGYQTLTHDNKLKFATCQQI